MLVVAIKILQTGTNRRPFTIYKGDYQFKCVKMLSLYLQFMTSAQITKNKKIICTVTKTRRKKTRIQVVATLAITYKKYMIITKNR